MSEDVLGEEGAELKGVAVEEGADLGDEFEREEEVLLRPTTRSA